MLFSLNFLIFSVYLDHTIGQIFALSVFTYPSERAALPTNPSSRACRGPFRSVTSAASHAICPPAWWPSPPDPPRRKEALLAGSPRCSHDQGTHLGDGSREQRTAVGGARESPGLSAAMDHDTPDPWCLGLPPSSCPAPLCPCRAQAATSAPATHQDE